MCAAGIRSPSGSSPEPLSIFRLAAFGINPGSEITLHQTRPAFVVRLGETELAIDKEIAREIFVRPLAD